MTDVTIFYDEETWRYSIRYDSTYPKSVEVEGVTFVFRSGVEKPAASVEYEAEDQ
jgi:hypothetical protein